VWGVAGTMLVSCLHSAAEWGMSTSPGFRSGIEPRFLSVPIPQSGAGNESAAVLSSTQECEAEERLGAAPTGAVQG
jgi:hypothetical protein